MEKYAIVCLYLLPSIPYLYRLYYHTCAACRMPYLYYRSEVILRCPTLACSKVDRLWHKIKLYIGIKPVQSEYIYYHLVSLVPVTKCIFRAVRTGGNQINTSFTRLFMELFAIFIDRILSNPKLVASHIPYYFVANFSILHQNWATRCSVLL